MDYLRLQQKIVSELGFLADLTVNSIYDPKLEPLHPLILQSAGLALKLLRNKKLDKLVIIYPYKDDIAQWLSILMTLHLMKTDFKNSSKISSNYNKGQKLRIDNLIVEFESEIYDPNHGLMLSVKSKSGQKSYQIDTFPFTEKLYFEAIETDRPLSSTTKVQELILKIKADRHKVPIDELLKIKSFGNYTFFKNKVILTTNLKKTQTFMDEYNIQNNKISELLAWGKLDINGDSSNLIYTNAHSTYNSIISPDLFGVSVHLEKNSNVKALIIDGSSKYVNNLGVLNNILSKGIKTVVIADNTDFENIKYLKELGYIVWNWNAERINNSKTLLDINQKTHFKLLNKYIHNSKNINITPEICIYPEIENIILWTLKVMKVNDDKTETLNELKLELILIANEISRQVYLPQDDWYENLKKRIAKLRIDIPKYNQWMTNEGSEFAKTLVDTLEKFEIKRFREGSGKIYKLKEKLLEFTKLHKNSLSKIAVILPRDSEVESCRLYWSKYFDIKELKNIEFISFNEFLKANINNNVIEVIVCGWLNFDRMTLLKQDLRVSNMTFLFYSIEKDWYNSAINKWNSSVETQMSIEEISELLEIDKEDLKFLEEKAISKQKEQVNELDIIEFEHKLRKYEFLKEANINSNSVQTQKAKLVIFNDGWYSFVTDSHKILTITDLINKNIIKKTISELKVSDIVIFTQSDKDILKVIADQILENNGESNIREDAAIWKKALRDEFNLLSRDVDRLQSLLSAHNCNRTPERIRQWLYDESIIGPQSINDIDLIAKATRHKELNEKLERVKNAVEIIRSSHSKASEFLLKKLSDKLPDILESNKHIANSDEERVILKIEEFGNLFLLKVDELTQESIDIETNKCNKIFRKDNN